MLITVFGRRGSGKTTLIKRLIPAQKKPVIIVDVLGNYTGNEAYIETQSHVEALQSLLEYVKDPNKHPGVIVVADSDMNRAVDYLCSALWKTEGGTLVLDEVDAISIAESPCFDEAIRYGRNKGIDIITGCRRPAELSKNITAGADIAFCFNTHEPRDIDYYCDFLGEELALKLPHLPPHHGVFKDFAHQKTGLYRTDVEGKIHILKATPEKTVLTLDSQQKKPPKKSNVSQKTQTVPDELEETREHEDDEPTDKASFI